MTNSEHLPLSSEEIGELERLRIEGPWETYKIEAANALPRLLSSLKSRGGGDEIAQPQPNRGSFDALADMESRKDAAYLERNQVVAALASAFPSGIARTAIPGWSDDWHGCVYIDLPTGQASWHYHDSHAHLFAHLPPYAGKWDGHTTDEKYARVAALADAKDSGPSIERGDSEVSSSSLASTAEAPAASGWTAKERAAIDELMASQQLSERAIIRQALAHYQMAVWRARNDDRLVALVGPFAEEQEGASEVEEQVKDAP